MVEDHNKGQPVRISAPGWTFDRTNHIRINRDNAERVVARYLRERISPADANDLARLICDGLVSSMPTANRKSLRGWRMIEPLPPEEAHGRIAAQIKDVQTAVEPRQLARAVWQVVYSYGTVIPDDLVA